MSAMMRVHYSQRRPNNGRRDRLSRKWGSPETCSSPASPRATATTARTAWPGSGTAATVTTRAHAARPCRLWWRMRLDWLLTLCGGRWTGSGRRHNASRILSRQALPSSGWWNVGWRRGIRDDGRHTHARHAFFDYTSQRVTCSRVRGPHLQNVLHHWFENGQNT